MTNQLFKLKDRARLAKVAATELSSLCMDVEVYPNFAMIGLLLREPPQDRVLVFSSEPGLGEAFEAFRRWYAEHGSAYRWVGFNSLAYDNHIVARILEGVDDPAELYTLSGALVNNNTWWRSTRDTAGGELSIDPFAMNGGAKARVGSLKECACKLDAPSLRTLPYAPDRVLTHDTRLRNFAAFLWLLGSRLSGAGSSLPLPHLRPE